MNHSHLFSSFLESFISSLVSLATSTLPQTERISHLPPHEDTPEALSLFRSSKQGLTKQGSPSHKSQRLQLQLQLRSRDQPPLLPAFFVAFFSSCPRTINPGKAWNLCIYNYLCCARATPMKPSRPSLYHFASCPYLTLLRHLHSPPFLSEPISL